MKRIDLPSDELVRLYIDEGLPIGKIAGRFSVSFNTIKKRLLEKKVRIRGHQELQPSPSENRLAYLAGLFDGEGWITMYHYNKPGHHWWTVSLGIGMTVEEPIKLFAQTFGLQPRWVSAKKPNYLGVWRCLTTSCKAKYVLDKLYSYLIGKRKQADLAYQMFELNRKARYHEGWRQPATTEDEIQLRNNIISRLKDVNSGLHV